MYSRNLISTKIFNGTERRLIPTGRIAQYEEPISYSVSNVSLKVIF